MNCIVTHIYRKGNQVASILANQASFLTSINVWQEVPMFIRESYIKNKLGRPNFRFCN